MQEKIVFKKRIMIASWKIFKIKRERKTLG